MSVVTRPQKEVSIGKTKYLMTMFDPIFGLDVLTKTDGLATMPPASVVQDIVLRSVTVNNIQPTQEWFNQHFMGNYEELFKLYGEIMAYNFGESDPESPNTESGIVE